MNILSLRFIRIVIKLVIVIFFCCLSGCSTINPNIVIKDGPPKIDIDVSKIKDAIPKEEPFHPYGTRDYAVNGKQYKVLKDGSGYVKQGIASWYGSKFHGNSTSTQEKYDLYEMTAASPDLPLPSYVQVINLQNGKKTIVRVNDRGPFYSSRILDLSYAAAKKLGFSDIGTAHVKVIWIDPKTWNNKESKIESNEINSDSKKNNSEIFLQIGAFAENTNANKLVNEINKFINDHIEINYKFSLYHVRIGPIINSSQENYLKDLLTKHGYNYITIIDI